MSQLPSLTGREIIAALEKAGFTVARVRGSHHILIHDDGRRTVIPVHFRETRGQNLMRYAVVIEKGKNSYGAYVPDLPGCVAVAETLEDVKQLITEAVMFHLEGLKEDGLSAPESVSFCEYIEVA
ncbi:MAG: addiction module toxin, HicA family [Moorea sp. SIO4A3]|nr:addiction module toxin, HicA family [Moorena sp. SIO4A3]